MQTTKLDLIESWENGLEDGYRVADRFLPEIVAGEVTASEIAELVGVDISDVSGDDLIDAWTTGFLEALDDIYTRNRGA